MAHSIIPSVEWQKILDMTDEKEQGIAATKYVYELETRIKRLNDELDKIKNQHIDHHASNSPGWECPSWYSDEQKRCFYGDFS